MRALFLVLSLGLAPQEKAAVPDARALAEAEKTVQTLFKKDYEKKLPRDRAALAGKLLEQARQSAGDPAAQFVLYRETADNFARGGDLTASFDAIDALGRLFEIDRVDLRVKALAAASPLARTPKEAVAHAVAQLETAEAAAHEDRFDVAEKQAQAAIAAAKKAADVPLLNRASARLKELAARKALFGKTKAAAAVLARNPDDPEANLAVGRYRCFVKGAWQDGLPLLAKGSDAALRSLAQKDLTSPDAPEKQVDLAGAWWALGESLDEAPKARARERAAHWYEKVLPTLSGLAKALAERRISELALAKLFRGDWLDIDPRRLAGATGVVEPPPSGFDYRVLNPMPEGEFDAVSVRIRATGKEPGNFMVALETRPSQSLYFDQVQRLLYTTVKERSAVRRDKVVPFEIKEDYILSLFLESGDLVVFLDGRQQVRVPTALRTIAALRLERLTGSGTMDQIKLRRKA